MTAVSPYVFLGVAAVIGLGVGSASINVENHLSTTPTEQHTFTLCHSGGRRNCVVDGDTIWMDGVKIRVADIDAPETHPPRCEREADLGNRATLRLLELVNGGAFTVMTTGERDRDRYGRQLRALVRKGRSLGDQLVSEGLARTWDGARHPWC